MTSLFDALAHQVAPGLWHQKGTVTGLSPLTVDLRGSGQTPVTDSMPWWSHAINDTVLVEKTVGSARVIATDAIRPQFGTVTMISGTTVVVNTWPQPLPYTGSSPYVGATVAISWGSIGGYVTGVLSADVITPPPGPTFLAPDDEPPTDLPAGNVERTVTISAFNTAIALNGTWTEQYLDMLQGTSPMGVGDFTSYWFYGSGFEGLQGTQVLSCTIMLRRPSDETSTAPAHLRMHAAEDRGETPPELLPDLTWDTTELRPGQWVEELLPIAMGQALADGTALGIAMSTAGATDYLALASIDGDNAWASSGALTITYRET